MNRMVIAALGALALVCSATTGDAQGVKGGYCRVDGRLIGNTGEGVMREKLWEYPAAKLSSLPLMGAVDIACADVGVPRSLLQDFGKRIWFNVSGPEGGPAKDGQLSVSDPNLNSGIEGETGIAVKDLAIYGTVTPNHICTYEVWVWAASCSPGK